MRPLGWWIAAFWTVAAMGQAPLPNSNPMPATLASIKTEEESARKSFVEKATKAVSAQSLADARAADEAYHAQMLSLMDRALALARLHPGEPKGLAALEWVAMKTSTLPGDNIAERGETAFRILAKAPVLDDAEIGLAIVHAKHIGPRCFEIEPFLRSVLSRSRRRDFVTVAQFTLGSYLAEIARMHDRLAAPISGPELMKRLSKDRIDHLQAIDGTKLRSEAEALLDQVVREDTDRSTNPGDAATRKLYRIQSLLGEYLGDTAKRELYRIRHLKIGQPAPELVGEDIDGLPIRLGDFRGKVVVLSFWPTLPSAYMLVSQEKDLAAAMKGRPIVLLGANVDANDRAEAKEAATQEGITWRSFWAGGRDGAILRNWHVQGWRPTVYTIDADGIIRDDQVGDKLNPTAFQSLVHAAEEAAR